MNVDRVRNPSDPQVFPSARAVMDRSTADKLVAQALDRWKLASMGESRRVAEVLEHEFPDQASPEHFWHAESYRAFRDFFVWGHDHDFGHGVTRAGAMGTRHREICAEALELGLLPASLDGRRVLDVGCWTGGDLLALAGLGGQLTAVEEHPIAARAAQKLARLLRLEIPVLDTSVYAERQEWAGAYDYVYCSGVIYHVTDPLLLLRILFAYLSAGGEIFLETKGATGEGSMCSYSGTLERGWNWYAPNETTLGRWLVDAGFDPLSVKIHRRGNGRLLAYGRKSQACAMRETAGFSRPGSWLEGVV